MISPKLRRNCGFESSVEERSWRSIVDLSCRLHVFQTRERPGHTTRILDVLLNLVINWDCKGSFCGLQDLAYNIPKFTLDFAGKYAQSPLIQKHIAEIEAFSKHLHENIVLPLMFLFGVLLEFPDEELLSKLHSYDKLSDDHFCYMKYRQRRFKEHEESQGLQVKGHTDLGSLTLLFRQPVAGLQILTDDDRWLYVRPLPGTVTVNLADTLSLLTGGYFKSSDHRVVAPPQNQLGYDRTGLLYFARPHNDTVLRSSVAESPVLQRNQAVLEEGFTRPITMAEFTVAKQQMLLNPHVYDEKRDEQGDVEIFAGFKDHRYK